MLFLAAGMGAGTGTGATPVIAELAHELGILTIAIVTTPPANEGPHRNEQARRGVDKLRKYVDAMIVLSNDAINELYGHLPACTGFDRANDVIAFAAYPGEESNIRALASQEKFNPAIVLNASIGKTWYVGGNQIGFSLEIKNLTNTICKTGGFEQMRLFSDDEYETTTGTRYSRFDSKYFYLYGTNYYLNIYFRF
jgi:hypothetical protein